MTKQAAEEREHAEKIHRYVDENGGRIFYGAMEAPQAAWDSPLEAFKAAAGHEKYISGRIHDLVRLARSEDDVATEHFLAWFVNEQVEEESNAQGWIDKISMLGENIVGLYTLNREAAERA
jgi:ferritin